MATCDHCLLEFPAREAVTDEIRGVKHTFCCRGCNAVYRLINDEGLDDFYRLRKEWEPGPASPARPDVSAFAECVHAAGDLAEMDLVIGGIRCASCVWLNEKILSRTKGVSFAQVNYATHRARIRWNPAETGLGQILDRIAAIGYLPKPFIATEIDEEQRKASRDLLIRFGTAGFLSMQLMLFSVALYAGYFQGMEAGLKNLFNWISLGLTTPALFYAGWPFLAGAGRGLRNLTFNMDVLIVAGAWSAYFYSIYQMTIGGEVYFDTAVMIITLILLGRYIESGAKRKASEAITRLIALAPQQARKLVLKNGYDGDDRTYASAERTMIASTSVRPGDLLEVVPGDKFPMDGIVRSGQSEADEAMLTGESAPVSKKSGCEVFGGTVNLYGRIIFEVTRTGNNTVLSRIVKAVEDAQARRAPVQALADRVVGIFVPAVLVISFATAGWWFWHGAAPQTALMNAVSVLVIACPCALGLATPLALLIGTSYGASQGILIKGGDVIERSKDIDVVVFDKTGTITEGRPSLVLCRSFPGTDLSLLQIAASLERCSEHSLGKAVVAASGNLELSDVADFQAIPGKGIRGTIDGVAVLAGSREFVEAEGIKRVLSSDEAGIAAEHEHSGATVVYVSRDGELIGVLAIADAPRPEAAESVAGLERMGNEVLMITGDGLETAAAVSRGVGIKSFQARRSPVQKAEEIAKMQATGRSCAMIGDGINDAPGLVEAKVGIAMGRATDIALESSDMVLMRSDLMLVPRALRLARKTYSVIRQNLFWAFFYNAVAIPLAVAGLLHPIVAAGAMALSSLSVVGNSLRARVR